MISIVGIPTDKHLSFLSGASEAPPVIMKEFHSEAIDFLKNALILVRTDLERCWKFRLTGKDHEFEIIKNSINNILKNGDHCISLGGDHSITYPIIAGYHKFTSKLNIIHFDAHPDLYEILITTHTHMHPHSPALWKIR